jgi:hypothetical protein
MFIKAKGMLISDSITIKAEAIRLTDLNSSYKNKGKNIKAT